MTKIERLLATAVSVAALSVVGVVPSFASPDPSGPESSAPSICAPTNPAGALTPFTCNIYETDANGAPSEDTGPILLPGLVSPGVLVLLETGTDQSTSNWSDIVVFGNNGETSTIEMFSDPEGGFDPAFLSSILEGGVDLFLTEDASGVTAYFSGGAQGVDNDYFFHSDADTNVVPEPLTLSLFGAGLVGAGALRRRKAKSL